MATTLSGAIIRLALSGTEATDVGATQRTISCPTSATFTGRLSSGTSAAQGNCIASLAGSVTAGTPVDITLNSMSAAGIDDPVILTSIKGILIQDTSAAYNASNKLQVGDGTLTNAFTAFFSTANAGGLVVDSQGARAIYAPGGYVVDSSHKILRLIASAGTINYQIDIIGTK